MYDAPLMSGQWYSFTYALSESTIGTEIDVD
jgi:hypothetical protein